MPQTSHMISVILVPTSELEPVIPTALHTSQDCNKDQMHKRPGNCGTLSDGEIVMSGASSWVTLISLTQLQALLRLCQGLSASPSGKSPSHHLCWSQSVLKPVHSLSHIWWLSHQSLLFRDSRKARFLLTKLQ